MREILFRAKETFNGEWVNGYYEFGYDAETEKPTHYMWVLNHTEKYGEMFMVIPETVGQYTGLTVPSGKIFEHDIVTAKFKNNGARFNFTVKYSYEKGGYVFDNGSIKVPFCDIRSVRIIGNIHDNPELLKGE